ncbi:MAG: hypothetical protein ACM3X1_01590 [Ignavibacteriales bacterium]
MVLFSLAAKYLQRDFVPSACVFERFGKCFTSMPHSTGFLKSNNPDLGSSLALPNHPTYLIKRGSPKKGTQIDVSLLKDWRDGTVFA